MPEILVGLATSFFNDKNRNVAKDMVELLNDTRQEVPGWLESIAYNSGQNSGGKNRGRRFDIFLVFSLPVVLGQGAALVTSDVNDLQPSKNTIECFHSRYKEPYRFAESEDYVIIKIEFNSQRVVVGHQYGRHFFVLEHQHGCCGIA